jgi:phosphoglycolate phosphatase-like HAD superfamily hydrolase
VLPIDLSGEPENKSGEDRSVSVVVTDLDNTLWDWFEMWYAGFRPFLDALVSKLDVPESLLKPEIKEVFTAHNTTEYAFLLEELPCVRKQFGERFDVYAEFGPEIEACQDGRRRKAATYPGVVTTLETIKRRGTKVVGFTESQSYYTTQRVRGLGLDGLIDVLYTPEECPPPSADAVRRARRKPDEYYELRQTKVFELPTRARKPDAELLLSILRAVGAVPDDAVYVGDSLVKDVLMAKQAGVRAVHARYGEVHWDERYELLRDVTHWDGAAVARERESTAEHIVPDCTLTRFSDLLTHFDFVSFSSTGERNHE